MMCRMLPQIAYIWGNILFYGYKKKECCQENQERWYYDRKRILEFHQKRS